MPKFNRTKNMPTKLNTVPARAVLCLGVFRAKPPQTKPAKATGRPINGYSHSHVPAKRPIMIDPTAISKGR